MEVAIVKDIKDMKSPSDVIHYIEFLEKKYRPFSWTCSDIEIWPLLRIEIYQKLSLEVLKSDHQPSKRGAVERIKSIIGTFEGVRTEKETDFLFISDNTSFLKINDITIDKLCDPIIDIVSSKQFTWQKWTYTQSPKFRLYFKSQCIGFPIFMAKIKSLLKGKRKTEIQHELAKTQLFELLDELNLEFPGRFSLNSSNIVSVLNSFIELVNWFMGRLSKIKPKFIFIVDYYNLNNIALLIAANKLKIRSADVQHGVQSVLHAAYSGWVNEPHKRYESLPSHYFVWSEYEKSLIDSWAKGAYHPVVLGNLIRSLYKKLESSGMELSTDKIRNLIHERNKENINVLFTMQYGIVYEDDFYQMISQTQEKFNWFIRLHPVDNNENGWGKMAGLCEKHKLDRVDFKICSSLPLELLLTEMNIHVSHSSSVVLDGHSFGLKSILFDNYGKLFFKERLEEGFIFFVNNYDEIPNLILRESVVANKILDDLSNEIIKKNISIIYE
ncbi:hypothetical protein [Aquirufa sp. Wall-65K1]